MYRPIYSHDDVLYHDLSKDGSVLAVVFTTHPDEICIMQRGVTGYWANDPFSLTDHLRRLGAVDRSVEIVSFKLLNHRYGAVVVYRDHDTSKPTRGVIVGFDQRLIVGLLDQIPVNGEYDDWYGAAGIKISDDDSMIYISSPGRTGIYKDHEYASLGAVYAFRSKCWLNTEVDVECHVISPSWLHSGHNFGDHYDISADGSTLIVSAKLGFLDIEDQVRHGDSIRETIVYTYDRVSEDEPLDYRASDPIVLLRDVYRHTPKLMGPEDMMVECSPVHVDTPKRIEHYSRRGEDDWRLMTASDLTGPEINPLSSILDFLISHNDTSITALVTSIYRTGIEAYPAVCVLKEKNGSYVVTEISPPGHKLAIPKEVKIDDVMLSSPNAVQSEDGTVISSQTKILTVHDNGSYSVIDKLTVFGKGE